MEQIKELLNNYLGPLVLVTLLSGTVVGINMILNRMHGMKSERTVHRQLIMLVVIFIAVFLLIVLLPMGESLRGQILSLLGILISAAIALSATTFLGNALAGILLRSVRNFNIGDFIYVNDLFGRVCERGLFHVEIQTQDRDLITLPNLYLTNNPVKVLRASGTIISAEVSLGYDVPRKKIKELLLQAAETIKLDAPFVHIKMLGDFSVLYRVSGMLTDVKQLLSTNSRLNGAILDVLQDAGIEIISPNFMNTRDVTTQQFIASSLRKKMEEPEEPDPEEIIFDKAEQAVTLEDQKACLVELKLRIDTMKTLLSKADDAQKERIGKMIERLKQQEEQLDVKITAGEKSMDGEKKTGG